MHPMQVDSRFRGSDEGWRFLLPGIVLRYDAHTAPEGLFLPETPMLPLLAGTALSVAGVACLFGSWNGATARKAWINGLGWMLLSISVVGWSVASGAEFGTTLALSVPGVIAWMFALRTAELREQRVRSRKPLAKVEPAAKITDARSWLRHLWLFALTVPVSAAAAAFVSIALCRWFPWSDTNEMVLAIFLTPLLWGCAAYWIVADPKLSRPTVTVTAAGAIGAALLFL